MKRGFRMLLEDFRGEKFTRSEIIGFTLVAILYVVLLIVVENLK